MADKLDIILEELREFRKDANDRLRSLEDDRAYSKGAAKMAIAASSVIAGVVSAFIEWIHK